MRAYPIRNFEQPFFYYAIPVLRALCRATVSDNSYGTGESAKLPHVPLGSQVVVVVNASFANVVTLSVDPIVEEHTLISLCFPHPFLPPYSLPPSFTACLEGLEQGAHEGPEVTREEVAWQWEAEDQRHQRVGSLHAAAMATATQQPHRRARAPTTENG